MSGGAVHIYSGSGIDSPRAIVVEYNIFGPDKRNRCFPIMNRKSTALYIWGGRRWAGYNRIVHNIVLGPSDRAISMHKCNFNLIANNIFLNTDGAPIQIGSSYGNIIVNNIIGYSPGSQEPGAQPCPSGYIYAGEGAISLSHFRNDLLLPRNHKGAEVPEYFRASKLAGSDPFVDRKNFDFRLKEGSDAIDIGMRIPYVTTNVKGTAPDAGAIEFGEKGNFPTIPDWLLEEWSPSMRGQ